MVFCLLTVGLPGPAYHGGAITCWSIIRKMRQEGHRVVVLSLFDTSVSNPYLQEKQAQVTRLSALGIDEEFIEYDHQELCAQVKRERQKWRSPGARVKDLFYPELSKFFVWAVLKDRVCKKLISLKPDAVFCYHFDALSAVAGLTSIPVMAGVGDLWHLPGFYRRRLAPVRFPQDLPELLKEKLTAAVLKRLMICLLKPCSQKGAFAAHYADWLRRQKDMGDMFYWQTPTPDPLTAEQKRSLAQGVPANRPVKKILLIGDLGSTVTLWGLQVFKKDILPYLDRALGCAKFEVHLVGAGSLSPELKDLEHHPAVKLRGRITPADEEFLSADVLLVPTPIDLGIRVRIISGFSFGSCIVTHEANRAGIPELRHDENALVARSGIEMAQQVVRVLQDDALRRRLACGARRTFEKYFSEDVAAGRIVEELAEMVRRKKGNGHEN